MPWRGPLAHADQHDALADRHDVAAFDRGKAVIGRRIAPPDVDLAREVGMEPVDRRGEDRLLMTCRPEQRVDRDAAVDPARGVAGIKRVGKRRQQVLGDAGGGLHELQHLAAMGLGEFLGRQAAYQRLGEIARLETVEIALDLVDQAQPDLIGHDLVVDDPLPGLRNRHGLGEQIVHLHDIDAAIAHLLHEVEVIALGVVDPQNVVEQQLIAVRWRQSLVRPPRRANHDLVKLAHLGMDAEGLLPCLCHVMLR